MVANDLEKVLTKNLKVSYMKSVNNSRSVVKCDNCLNSQF